MAKFDAPKRIKGVTITTHYPKSDPDKDGDYYDVDIIVNAPDGLVYGMQYGDAYHDRGMDKAEGFLDALIVLYGKFPVRRVDIADREE